MSRRSRRDRSKNISPPRRPHRAAGASAHPCPSRSPSRARPRRRTQSPRARAAPAPCRPRRRCHASTGKTTSSRRNRIVRLRHCVASAVRMRRDQRLSLRMRQQRDLRPARAERRKMGRFLREHLQRVVLEIPSPVAADADRNDLVPRRIHRGHHGQRRSQRNLMLAGSPAKQNANPDSLSFRHPCPAPPAKAKIRGTNCSETRDGFRDFRSAGVCTQ